MDAFIEELTSLPTVFFTVLMAIILLYWVTVIIGAMDFDLLGGGDVDVDVDLDADADLDVDADTDIGALSSALSGLRLTAVPLTISISLIVFWAWVLCYVGMWAGAELPLVRWLLALIVTPLSLFLGLILASFCVRPLIPLFATARAPRAQDIVGLECTVVTGRVDANFGQARCNDAGRVVMIAVRSPGEVLSKGQRALILSYDPAARTYELAPSPVSLD